MGPVVIRVARQGDGCVVIRVARDRVMQLLSSSTTASHVLN